MHSLAWVSTCSMSGSEDVKVSKASVVHSHGLHSRRLHSHGLKGNETPQWGVLQWQEHRSADSESTWRGGVGAHRQRAAENPGRGESMCRGPELREVGAGCRVGCVPDESGKTGLRGEGGELGKTVSYWAHLPFSAFLLPSFRLSTHPCRVGTFFPNRHLLPHAFSAGGNPTHPSRPFPGKSPLTLDSAL